LIVLIILTSCEKTGRIKLKDYDDNQEVIFKTENATLYFSRRDVINQIKKTIKKYDHLSARKKLMNYIESKDDKKIIIVDSIVRKLDTTMNFMGSTSDTLIVVADRNDIQTLFAEEMKWTSIELLEDGRAKVFDKINNDFVEYIYIHRQETKELGTITFSLPNGTKFLDELLYIQ